MKKALLIIVVLCFINCSSTSQKVIWNGKKQLTFSDFKGGKRLLRIKNSKHYIGGISALYYEVDLKTDSVTKLPKYSISAIFYKNWSSIYSKRDTSALRHEQIHFNLYELYCRKVRKSWDSLNRVGIRKTTPYNLAKNKHMKQCGRANNDFDRQEDIILGKYSDSFKRNDACDSLVLKWENEIDRELDLYLEYK